tara:strand:+ start:57551 stop:57784 length:234 start_codon:yes stop_codon:yes gene_type:complete
METQLYQKLQQYLGGDANIVEGKKEDGYQEVCDMNTGECYTIRSRDGLIERVENAKRVNRQIKVESPNGQTKQLLNG